MKSKQKISVEPLLLLAILLGILVAATHAQDQVRSMFWKNAFRKRSLESTEFSLPGSFRNRGILNLYDIISFNL